MLTSLAQTAEALGNRLVAIRPERLSELKEELLAFRETEPLNGFQKYIIDHMYTLSLPEAPFQIRSILLFAQPHPAYARLAFDLDGVTHTCMGLTGSDFDTLVNAIMPQLTEAGYHAVETPMMPLKRLAVQSGLAKYGRNNITYVDGMGSHVSYGALCTDIPMGEDNWRPMLNAAECEGCGACLAVCPTKAIRKERFLIDNQRCLSAINESGGEFPDWLPADVHHTPYDCLRCQMICPMNAGYNDDITGPIHFTEAETRYLLAGPPYVDIPEALAKKTKPLDLFQWADGLDRNLRALFAQTPRGA